MLQVPCDIHFLSFPSTSQIYIMNKEWLTYPLIQTNKSEFVKKYRSHFETLNDKNRRHLEAKYVTRFIINLWNAWQGFLLSLQKAQFLASLLSLEGEQEQGQEWGLGWYCFCILTEWTRLLAETLEKQSMDGAHSLVFLHLPSPSGLGMTNLSDLGFVKRHSVSF